MEQSAKFLEETLSHMRAGKANVHILDGIKVNSYGASLPLSNVAAITTPDQRTIAIKPWDKSMFPHIEKAIIDSEVGRSAARRARLPASVCAMPAATASTSLRRPSRTD